jgi:hypothetical protein
MFSKRVFFYIVIELLGCIFYPTLHTTHLSVCSDLTEELLWHEAVPLPATWHQQDFNPLDWSDL